MDAAFLPRTQADVTTDWITPHLQAENPSASIIKAIQATGTPVYLLERPRLNQWMWFLCRPKTGFIALNHWRGRLAAALLALCTGQHTAVGQVGFFWYPMAHVSPAVLSYDVHHWRMATLGRVSQPFTPQAHNLSQPDAIRQQVDSLDEQELTALQQAVNQELDALTALRTTLLRQQNT